MKIGTFDLNCGKTLVVAELSANHRQSLEIAMKTIDAAKEAGADAVKLQTYTADTLTIDARNEHFMIQGNTLWDGRTFHDLYREAYTPWEWQPKLKEHAEALGLILFSSPFDPTAVDFLEEMGVPAYKIASFEILDIPLIEYVASKGKPVILSTGIATREEILDALNACRSAGNSQVALLKCTSQYPTPMSDANIGDVPVLQRQFNVPIGLSDHTLGYSIPIAAVTLGACIVEKHFILDRKLGGPDAAFSLEPKEFGEMVRCIHDVESAIGTSNLELTSAMKKGRIFGRSLFVVEDIRKGESFTPKNLRSIRPNLGLPPKFLNEVLGNKAAVDIQRGTPLTWDMIDG